MKARENGRKRLKKKTLLKEWHKSVGFVKGKFTWENLHFFIFNLKANDSSPA